MLTKDKPYAYAGKILRINLTNGKISTEPVLRYAKEWLGSSGLAIKILYDELRSWVTPYEPANKLVFGAGALQGTMAPGACKMTVSTLSPVTGGWASGASDSYVGGQLKFAGYDLIVIEGKAHKPVYLWINDEHIEFRDASHLWGKTTWDTFKMIREELGDSSLHTLSIGPAGENLVRGACIIQDKGRAFGRCGSGAVMGSKNVKAVVAKGSGGIRVADPERFLKIVHDLRKIAKDSPFSKVLQTWGSPAFLTKKQEVCGANYKNFQETKLPDEMYKAILPTNTVEKYKIGNSSFPGCAIGCGQMLHFTDGRFEGLKTESCQLEMVITLQGRLGVWDPQFMFGANAYCNQLGLDVDMAGGTTGWAMECFQRGIITEKDTDGLKLEWGDVDTILELFRKISYREGFGNILAEGCARASEIIGRDSRYYCMQIKNQELYEPCRGANAWSLGTTTSTRGGGHTTGAPWLETTGGLDDIKKAAKVFGIKDLINDPLSYEAKAKMVVFTEVLQRTANCLGICHYNTVTANLDFMSLPEMAKLYSAATGWKISVRDLKRIAEKQINLEKAFNLIHTDFDRKDDLPTPRDLNEPIPTGNIAGWKIDKAKYDEMLNEYYDLHGWDKETSYPTKRKLRELGLEYVADELEKIGKLR
jgi:aldehyde:ferredoxin oxidoreductase